MSKFDTLPRSTDSARSEMEANIENGTGDGYWGKIKQAYQTAKLKCKMMCSQSEKASDTPAEGECQLTKSKDE